MPPSLGPCLPDETLNAILVRLHDGGAWDPPPKRGLASCGLACRHWAQTIRPMLFQNITLRSARDVDELFALLAAPPLFGRMLRQCIRSLHIVEDHAALPRTSWSHLLFLRLRPPIETHWTLEGVAELSTKRISRLPFLSLPRAVPMKATRVRYAKISGIHLSLQHLGRILCDLPLERLHLENITFQNVSDDLSPLRRAWSRRTTELHFVSMTRCITETAGLSMWLELICLLFAKQDRAPVDALLQEKLIGFIDVCASVQNCKDTIPTLSTNAVWRDIDDTMDGRTTFLGYRFVVEGVASANVWMDDWYHNPAHISGTSFICPPATATVLDTLLNRLLVALYELFDELIAALVDMNGDEIHPLYIALDSTTPVRELLGGVLEGDVFSRVPKLLSNRVVMELPVRVGYSLEEIMAAPVAVGEGDGCVVLTTAQRVDWVMRRSRDDTGQRINTRDEYLRELQAAVQPTGAVEHTALGVVPPTP